MKKIINIAILFFAIFNASCAAYAQEIFYGGWVVRKIIASAPVTGYDESEARQLIGKKISYSAHSARYDDVIKEMPYYKKSTLSEAEFKEEFRVGFKRLGVNTADIVEVDVYVDADFSNFWDSAGNTVFIKNKDSLILFSRGIFYELHRDGGNN